MKYVHILSYVRNAIWAIDPEKLDEIVSLLAFRAAGNTFTPDEIAARIASSESGVSAPRGAAIAVVPLRGTIAHRMGTMAESSGGMSAERFTSMIRSAAADPNVGAILIDCDSPGGTIPGVPEAADAVFAARETKKVVALANGQMCSAAFWICSQAHEIVAIPSLLEPKIGSIGAYSVHQDVSAALEKAGIKTTIVSAGKYKTEGNPFEKPSEEYLAMRKADAEVVLGQFVQTVARGFGVSASEVRNGFGEGRALSAVDAKKAGMVHRIASVEDTIARLSSHQGRSRVGAMADASVRPEGIDIAAEIARQEGIVAAEAAKILDRKTEGEDRARRLLL